MFVLLENIEINTVNSFNLSYKHYGTQNKRCDNKQI